MNNKSTLKEIEERFDKDVERFSNLDTGQQTTLDAVFNMDLITDGIAALYPALGEVLDIGCGAGNYPVRLLMKVASNPNVTLVDLSRPMLERAEARVQALTGGRVRTIKSDFNTAPLEPNTYDVIIATAVLHHLREDEDWEMAFSKLYRLLKPGGSLWIFDLVEHDSPIVRQLLYHERYGAFLSGLKDAAYQRHVFDYIKKEDSPRSVLFQTDLLRKAGFAKVDLLHKHLCFASLVAFKPGGEAASGKVAGA